MKRLPFATTLLISLFLLSGCDSFYDDHKDSCLVGDYNTYLSIEVANLTTSSPNARAQGDAPSINKDQDEHEDYIRNLAVLIFDSAGNKIADEVTINPYNIVMKVKSGLADLYFIANFPDQDKEIIRTMSQSDLDTYIQKLRAFDSYQGATDKSKYFPMSRVYRGQVIPEGGTMTTPKPFRPNVGTTNQLSPVSNYGIDYKGASTQEKVNLVRSCAKITIQLNGKALKDITSVVYHNAVQNFSFSELTDKDDYAGIPLAPTASVQLRFYTISENNNSQEVNLPIADDFMGGLVSQLYVPERLFADDEQPKWIKNDLTDDIRGGAQYIAITLSNGLVYNIPILFNADKAKSGQSYVDFARNGSGTENPNFDVVRNMHYKYVINISKRVVVSFSIEPMREEILDKVHIFPTVDIN